MNQQNIYQVYRHIRRRNIVFIGIVGIVVAGRIPLFFMCSWREGDWLELFNERNWIYLILVIVLLIALLVELYYYVSCWDKRQIRKQIMMMGIFREQFEEAMSNGRFFAFNAGSNTMYVSGDYCIMGVRGKYHVVRSRNILKLGLESISAGKQSAYRLHCLMRNGEKYTLYMKRMQAIEIAQYLKEALSPS